MLELVGSMADGGLPLLFPPEHFSTVMDHIRRGASQAGRLPDDVDIAACIWCSISADRASAERALAEKIAYYGHTLSPLILQRLGVDRAEFEPIRQAIMVDRNVDHAVSMVTPDMMQIGIAGSAKELVPRLEHLAALGARHLSFGPPLGPDPLEAIDVLGREVLPHLRHR
jgi:5,10-methylenetetrahydromethanopterin reductase